MFSVLCTVCLVLEPFGSAEVGREFVLRGSASGGIHRVVGSVDGYPIGSVLVRAGKFSLRYTFNQAGVGRRLVLDGVGFSNVRISRVESTLNVGVSDRISFFRSRYSLSDPLTKRVDNKGNGFEPLYGVRNFRVVLHGVLYRGGANNSYHRVSPRSNINPLQPSALSNLCREGFGSAIYLYSTNYTPWEGRCVDQQGANNTFAYQQISVLGSSANTKEVLRQVHSCVGRSDCRPTYLHCWNGWHASGYISAVALKQFCGYTSDQAIRYWKAGTDGNFSGYDSIVKAVSDFVPYPEFRLSADQQKRICPAPASR